MAKHLILFLLVFLSVIVSYGQKLGDYYISVSGDSSQGGRIKFLSDTTVELSSIPRHMSPSLRTVYNYTSTDATIEILPQPVSDWDRQPAGLHLQFFAFDTPIKLTKIEEGFIDNNRSLIYVRQKDFGENPDIAYIINGRTYIQDVGVTDGYGIIKKQPKTNKALQKKLKDINKDNSTIEVVRGLDAYRRFGIERIFGAVVITTKK